MTLRPLNAASRARLKAKIARIPEGLRAIAQASLEASGEQMVTAMKQAAPKEDGQLIASIRMEALAAGEGIGVRILAGGPLTTRPVRKTSKGNAPTYDYALAQEFGTAKMAANPFFFPTYRRLKGRTRSRVTAALKKAIKRAAEG